MAEDANYVCNLDEASIKKAKIELNENPQDRLAAVQAFRDWIKAQEHIKCPKTDTPTLLKILRGTKFSQLKAREKLEEYLLLRDKAPQWFKDLDAHEPMVKMCAEAGYAIVLPDKTPEGCTVVMYRMSVLNDLMSNKNATMQDLIRFGNVFFQLVMDDEMTQVNGLVFFVDFTGMTGGLMTKMLNPDMSKFHKMYQKSMVGRFKAFHDYNAGLFFETMMAFYRPFMPKKWMDRIVLHDNMETVYKHIPMKILPVEYLPDDYKGPNAGSISDITEKCAKQLADKDFRDDLLYRSSSAFSLDESKRPKETVTQHFRKLNVD